MIEFQYLKGRYPAGKDEKVDKISEKGVQQFEHITNYLHHVEGMTRPQAVREASRRFPQLHDDYIKRCQAGERIPLFVDKEGGQK